MSQMHLQKKIATVFTAKKVLFRLVAIGLSASHARNGRTANVL